MHRPSRILASLGIVLAAVLVPVVVSAPPAAAADTVLCHATNSTTNPYNPIKIKEGDPPRGHETHTGPVYQPGMTGGWGDIIPATGDFPGQNNDAFGQAVISRDCRYPTEDPSGWLTPIVTCYRFDEPDLVYQVLYSYRNDAPFALTVPHGASNTVSPASMAPYSPETFSPGYVMQGFAVTLAQSGTSPSDTLSTWTLAGASASFVPASTGTCGPDVVVSADGNGAGWAIVALLSIPLLGVPLVLLLRRAGFARKEGR